MLGRNLSSKEKEMNRTGKTADLCAESIQSQAPSPIRSSGNWPDLAADRPGAEQATLVGLSGDTLLPKKARAIAFDLDAPSLAALREAIPGWQIGVICGATVPSLPCDWNPGTVELLVVGVREDVTETLALCRFLAFAAANSRDCRPSAVATLGPRRNPSNRTPHGNAPLLVLVSSGQESLVRELLEAGADNCLVLPVHAKEVASMVAHMWQGNQPGRHTLNLDRAQCEDRWRDDGGQG
jgi:hypothetical protein